jgi:hypothetical protein
VAVDLKDAALLPLLHLHLAPSTNTTDNSSAETAASAAQVAEQDASEGSDRAADGKAAGRGSSRNSRESTSTVVNQGGLVRLPKRPKVAAAAAAAAGQQEQQAVPWVVCGKHLCGAATDFALRGCYHTLMEQQQQQQQQQPQQQQFDLQGLAIASCCHHR